MLKIRVHWCRSWGKEARRNDGVGEGVAFFQLVQIWRLSPGTRGTNLTQAALLLCCQSFHAVLSCAPKFVRKWSSAILTAMDRHGPGIPHDQRGDTFSNHQQAQGPAQQCMVAGQRLFRELVPWRQSACCASAQQIEINHKTGSKDYLGLTENGGLTAKTCTKGN